MGNAKTICLVEAFIVKNLQGFLGTFQDGTSAGTNSDVWMDVKDQPSGFNPGCILFVY